MPETTPYARDEASPLEPQATTSISDEAAPRAHSAPFQKGASGQEDQNMNPEQEQHQRQAAGLLQQLQHLAPQARAALHALQLPLREAEEEADRREKILQQELAPLTEEMRSLRRQRAELVEEQHSLQANIASLQSQHDGLTQEIRGDQARLDELNGKIVNASPVNQMKAAIQKLTVELHDMQISIGIGLQRLQAKSDV